MSSYPYPKWYRKSFPYLDVGSKLGLSALMTAVFYKMMQKEKPSQTYYMLIQPPAQPKRLSRRSRNRPGISKIAAKTFFKQVLPEAVALAIGVGAADIGSNLFLKYLERRQQQKQKFKFPIKTDNSQF